MEILPFAYDCFRGEYPDAEIQEFLKIVKQLNDRINSQLLNHIEDKVLSRKIADVFWNEDMERFERQVEGCRKRVHVEIHSVRCLAREAGIYVKIKYMQAMNESIKFNSSLLISTEEVEKLFNGSYKFEEFGLEIETKAVGDKIHHIPVGADYLKPVISPMSGMGTRQSCLIALEILSKHRKFSAYEVVDGKKTKVHLSVFKNFISTSDQPVDDIYISRLNTRCSFIIDDVKYEIIAEDPAPLIVGEVASDADKSESCDSSVDSDFD
jgi:hypothetical protein